MPPWFTHSAFITNLPFIQEGGAINRPNHLLNVFCVDKAGKSIACKVYLKKTALSSSCVPPLIAESSKAHRNQLIQTGAIQKWRRFFHQFQYPKVLQQAVFHIILVHSLLCNNWMDPEHIPSRLAYYTKALTVSEE